MHPRLPGFSARKWEQTQRCLIHGPRVSERGNVLSGILLEEPESHEGQGQWSPGLLISKMKVSIFVTFLSFRKCFLHSRLSKMVTFLCDFIEG